MKLRIFSHPDLPTMSGLLEPRYVAQDLGGAHSLIFRQKQGTPQPTIVP